MHIKERIHYTNVEKRKKQILDGYQLKMFIRLSMKYSNAPLWAEKLWIDEK